MGTETRHVTIQTARRYLLIKHGLFGDYRFRGKQGAYEYVRQASCLQFDPVDVIGRNAELTLQSRVRGFRKKHLNELLYKDRKLFDYPDKEISIIPMEDWPYFQRYRDISRNNKHRFENLEELEQCGFVRKYSVLGKKNKGAVFQLIDSYTLFYFKVLSAASGKGEHFLTSVTDSRFMDTWEGLAFERVCLMHVDEIKKALQIGGVVCEVSPWRSSGDEHVQIDMLIDRNDGVVNLCEMKFSREPYELTAEELARLQRRRRVFKEETNTRKAVHLTLIVSPELKKNAYANDIQSTVTIDDLFRA